MLYYYLINQTVHIEIITCYRLNCLNFPWFYLMYYTTNAVAFVFLI